MSYAFRWNNYNHPNLVLAYDMNTRTPAGLMKNLAKTGSAYDGTINGAYTEAPPLIRAKKKPCMIFDGVTNHITLAHPLSSLSAFSILGWMRGGATVWSIKGSENHIIYHYGDSRLLYYRGGYKLSNVKFLNIDPKMFSITSDTSGLRIYIDGRMDVYYDSVGAHPAIAEAYVGCYFDQTIKFSGRLDNMMFFNIALSPDQIQSIWRSANPR